MDFTKLLLSALSLLMLQGVLLVAGEEDAVPQPGTFPEPGVGVYFAGELVSIDHVNRRGELRLVGNGEEDRYHGAPSQKFALLPYGMVRYHGAPAELRDIPIGTVLHGIFLLPTEGVTSYPPIEKKLPKYALPQTQALSLEDGFSFYERQGQSWKIVSIDLEKGKLNVVSTGKAAQHGLAGEQSFDLDVSSRIWKGRALAELSDLAPDQEVQLNFTWCPDWRYGVLQISDAWIDQESRDAARESQRRIHVRHERTRWLPAWVDSVEHLGAGKAIVTMTLFGGKDQSLYDEVRTQFERKGGASVAAAEWTLRTWWQEHDSRNGAIVDMTDLPNPPPGSSGVQVRVQFSRLIEGYRPGRIVRFRPNSFPSKVKLPAEERINSLDHD